MHKILKPEQLKKKMLAQHELWLNDPTTGKRFEVAFKNLNYYNLSGANLEKAIIIYSNMEHTSLTGADLMGADLTCSKLEEADLTCAGLLYADLSCANLTNANLTNVLARGIILSFANLTNTCLVNEFFCEANFKSATLKCVMTNKTILGGCT